MPVNFLTVIIALAGGFVVGVVVNLLADYLPARQHYLVARHSPFASDAIKPGKPLFFPRRKVDHGVGRRWSMPFWSGVIARLTRSKVWERPRYLRRIVTELGLALAYVFIISWYHDSHSLPFMLFYAAAFALIIIVDMEHRWVLWEIVFPTALVALAESYFWTRVLFEDSLRGGLYGFLILFAFYQGGFLFGRLMHAVTGRRIGRTILGFGDVELGLLMGLIIGWEAIGVGVLVMIFSGAIAALIFMVYKSRVRGKYRLFSAIPYGPYIILGTAAMLYIPWIPTDMLLKILGRI